MSTVAASKGELEMAIPLAVSDRDQFDITEPQ